MKKVAQLSEEDRRDLFSETAAKKGIKPAAAEKDFWLCWVLMIVFEHPDLSKILKLKGGTSLSKCYNLIDRFSEDMDLILDWTELTAENPNEERTKTQQDKFNKKLNQLAIQYIKDDLLPILQEKIDPYCKAEIDKLDGHTINIVYLRGFSDQYLRSGIRLEIGPLGSMIPSTINAVSPYAAEVFPETFEISTANVHSIKVERTFWEKITILHAEAFRTGSPKLRYSRHYYDVYKMLDKNIGEEALQDSKLLEEVVKFKQQFYYSKQAEYDLAKPGTFHLIPNKAAIKLLKDDYQSMREMIFGDYPEFDEIIEKLESFQNKLNKL